MSVEEQVKLLAKEETRVAVGTPNRLLKLFERGALSSDSLLCVMVDMARDKKSFNIFDHKDIRKDFFQTLSHVFAQGDHSSRSQTLALLSLIWICLQKKLKTIITRSLCSVRPFQTLSS